MVKTPPLNFDMFNSVIIGPVKHLPDPISIVFYQLYFVSIVFLHQCIYLTIYSDLYFKYSHSLTIRYR